MAGVVLGTAGSILGGMFFGPVGASIGYLAGSLIGNLLDPPKVEGPRLTDLKAQHSTYGTMIPILYGPQNRIAGNVIDQTDLVEHKQTSGGKGGPRVTTYTYSVSLDIMLCEGPINGIGKIWADLRLVSATGQATAELPLVLYPGNETQLPDPTFEAERGAGEVPAYRGRAHVVFTDLQLEPYFNRIPSFEWEVEATGDPLLERISTFAPNQLSVFTGFGTMPLDGAYLEGNELVCCVYTEDTPLSHYQEFRYSIAGVLVNTGPLIDIHNVYDTSLPAYNPSTNSNVAFGVTRGAGSVDVSRWYVAGARGTERVQVPTGGDEFSGGRPLVIGSFVYKTGGNSTGSTELFVGKWGFRNASEIAGVPESQFFNIKTYTTLGRIAPRYRRRSPLAPRPR